MTLKMQLLVSVVANILDNLQMNKERIRLDGLPLFFSYTYFILHMYLSSADASIRQYPRSNKTHAHTCLEGEF